MQNKLLYQAVEIDNNIISILKSTRGWRVREDNSCYIIGSVLTAVRTILSENEDIFIIGNNPIDKNKDAAIMFYGEALTSNYDDADTVWFDIKSSFNETFINEYISSHPDNKIHYLEDNDIIKTLQEAMSLYSSMICIEDAILPMVSDVFYEISAWVEKNPDVHLNLFGVFDINKDIDEKYPSLKISSIIKKLF